MIFSLYFIAIGGIFFKMFVAPKNPDNSTVERLLSLWQRRPVANKKAAKTNV